MSLAQYLTGGGEITPAHPENNQSLSAYLKGESDAPEQEQQTTAPKTKLPFMAESFDKYGVPYYGEGFQGFARKVFAKIFDPDKLLTKPTEEQARLMEQGLEKSDDILNRAGWDEWLEQWTGITGRDVTQSALALNLAARGTDEEGNVSEDAQAGNAISTAAGIAYRGGGQVISAGLEALGVGDKISRKVQAFNVALDEIGDASSVLPDFSRADELLVKLLGDTPTARRLGNLMNALTDINPVVAGYNLVRAATAGKSLYQNVKTVKDNLRASNMIYTMYWEEGKKEEYMRRVQAGENPDLVMRDLENTWVELAGSIVGDPTTYMGMGIIGKIGQSKTPIRLFGKTIATLPWETVGRIPGFTELLGLKNIGRARVLAAGDEFRKIASPETEKAFQALGKVADENAALPALRNAINAAKKQVTEFRGSYGFFSPDSGAKAELTKKTVGTFFHALAKGVRNPDDMLETFRAYRNLSSGNDQAAVRAFAHLKEVHGALPFTNAGMQAMEFMTRLIDNVDMVGLVKKHGDNLEGFADEAFGKLNKVVDDFYPSVDDMAKASQEVKQLGKAASQRQTMLAKSFDDLKKTRPQVIWANNVNNVIAKNKVYRGLQSFYAGTLMGMRPAYAVRNLLSNTVTIWHDLGARAGIEAFTTGAETLVKSTFGRALKQNWANDVISRETEKVTKILGFLPTQTIKGVGSAGREGLGFIAVGQDVEKVHSAIIMRYMVETEMEKALRYGGIPDVAALGLPQEMAESLLTHAMESFGDVKETLRRFRADQATGFYETWRHLELDPAFKDTLRRSNLLDELEDIRKLAPDPVTFSEQMNAFIRKIDDLAQRTADEPALVSAENPLSDAVVTLEKAFDEGGRKLMSEEELNQFRALVELRSQLRNQYQDYVDIMRDRIGRLLPPEQVRPFEEQFSKLRNVLEEGNGKWRGYADELYKGVYAQSRKGEPPARLWNQVRTVMLDMQDGKPVLKKISLAEAYPNVDPTIITNKEFDGMMWKWFKEQQASFWRGYTQDFITGQDAILKQMAQAAGANIDEIKLAEYGNLANPRLKQITDLTKQIGDWESYLDYRSFSQFEPNATDINRVLDTLEESQRAASNVNAPPPIDQEITISSDIEGSPLKLLQEKGGVVLDEFSDIMGGKSGIDKKGVMPGLFTKNGLGLDDAGRVLADAGFITPEQADDLNFVREFIRNPTGKTKTFVQEGARLSDMDLSNVPNWKGGKSHLFNAVNADRAKRGQQAYATIDEVPFEEAAQVLRNRTKPIPPYVEGSQPTVTRQLYENMKGGLREAIEDFRNGTLTKWGQTAPLETKLNDLQEAQLTKWAAELNKRMTTNRAAVSAIADETRNFILHDYNKTYGDGFASFFTMFHYWPSRTYMRWGERLADGPGWVANFAKLKAANEKIHSEQPEFYRHNVVIPKLPGLNNSPMYFNLEATLNPLYSLMGADFNDPKRRVDWLSSSVDDMGKFGFNLAMPLQWLMAFRLYNKGEDEAARRWLGRLVPATQDLKAGLNLLKEKTGIDLMPDISILPGAKYGEFDPFINAQGGFDAYEEKRIGRALTNMVLAGELSAEEAYDVMYQREGAEFDEAAYRAILERAGGQMASYFGGVGFKTRTEGDLQVEQFYKKYYQLLSMRESISPESYRQQFDQLRSEYPFSDTVLLAARGGDERDAVYAYNVLSRIPPGDSTDILNGMGLSDELVQKFYNDKGDFSSWTEQDKDRFMGAMVDLGMTYALPDNSTRQEWNDAKDMYRDAQEQISEELGLPYGSDGSRGVWDVINTYYDLKDEDQESAQLFKEVHPEIDEAFMMLNEAKISDPILAKYYASLDTVESYYSGKIRAELAEQFGKDIYVTQSAYYDKGYEGKAAQRAFLAQHPELRAYWSKKKELEAGMNQKILEIASTLPQAAPGAILRDDFQAANTTQQKLAQMAQPQATWEQVSASMSDGLQESIANLLYTGAPLPKAAQKELDYLAKREDYYNADDLLRAAMYALMGGGQMAQQPQAQPTGSLSAYLGGQP